MSARAKCLEKEFVELAEQEKNSHVAAHVDWERQTESISSNVRFFLLFCKVQLEQADSQKELGCWVRL